MLRSLASGEYDSLLAHARFGDDTAAAAKGLAQIDSVFRGRRLDSIQLIGANQFSSTNVERLTLSYEMRADTGWQAATVTTLDTVGLSALIGLHVEPLPGELRKVNEFTLRGRGPSQYLSLLLVIALTAFSLGVAGFLATRRRFPNRWRWVAASLVGVTAVYVNWTTGEVSGRMLTVQLLSASAVRPGEFAPWVLSFSFPIGAIVALERYLKWRAERDKPALAPVLMDTSPPPE